MLLFSYKHNPILEEFLEVCMSGNMLEINRLLKTDEIATNLTYRSNCALRLVADKGLIQVVNRLLELEDVVTHVAALDNCALRWACQNGHIEVVNRLLEFQAVQQQVTDNNNEAFIKAATNNHTRVVERLLDFSEVKKACGFDEATEKSVILEKLAIDYNWPSQNIPFARFM